MKISGLDGEFTINRFDMLVLDCSRLAYECDSDVREENRGWRTLSWITYEDIPGYTGHRLLNAGLLEREYDESLKRYFYRITQRGLDVIKIILNKKGNKL